MQVVSEELRANMRLTQPSTKKVMTLVTRLTKRPITSFIGHFVIGEYCASDKGDWTLDKVYWILVFWCSRAYKSLAMVLWHPRIYFYTVLDT